VAVNDHLPLFIDVATFGRGADACAAYPRRGRAVAVTGRLSYRESEKDGVKRAKHQVVGPDGRDPRRPRSPEER
jgi:single-stranded DNA-binding protein